jgi:hypothetical protein
MTKTNTPDLAGTAAAVFSARAAWDLTPAFLAADMVAVVLVAANAVLAAAQVDKVLFWLNGEGGDLMRYAQILNNKVHWIFEDFLTLEELGRHKFNLNQITLVDITNIADVQEGWDYDGVNFTDPNVLTLDEAKARYINAAKVYRDKQEVTPVTYNGNTYDYDAKARERLLIARTALEDAGGTGTIDWTLADQSRVTIGLTDFIGINAAAATRSNTLHINYTKTKAAILAAETVAELETIMGEVDKWL